MSVVMGPRKRRNCRSGDPNLTWVRKQVSKRIVEAMKREFDADVRITKIYPSLGWYRSSPFDFNGSALWEAWGETLVKETGNWGKFGHWYSFDRLSDCAKFKIVLTPDGGVTYEVGAPEAPDFNVRNNKRRVFSPPQAESTKANIAQVPNGHFGALSEKISYLNTLNSRLVSLLDTLDTFV